MIRFHHNKNLKDTIGKQQKRRHNRKQQKSAKNHLYHKWEEAIMQI